MAIASFIEDRLRERLAQHPLLVVYDAEGRYASIVDRLEQSGTAVVRESHSPVEAREDALRLWTTIGRTSVHPPHAVVYVERPKPTQRELEQEPFAAFVQAGWCFPVDAAESYRSLCLLAYPARDQAILELFDLCPVHGLFDAVVKLTGIFDEIIYLIPITRCKHILPPIPGYDSPLGIQVANPVEFEQELVSRISLFTVFQIG